MNKFMQGLAIGVFVGSCILGLIVSLNVLSIVLPAAKFVAAGASIIAVLVTAVSMAFAMISGSLAVVYSWLEMEDEAEECLVLAKRCLLLGLSAALASNLE